jgi:hypothetical protein
LEQVIRDENIKAHNIWNIDEKGFMIGRANQARVICLRGRRNPRLVMGGQRDWVTVLEGVSATGALLPPLIIHKGEAQYMGWHANVTKEEPAYFAFSKKGWTDNELGVEYLKQCFEPETGLM